jgi:hypothetical protein
MKIGGARHGWVITQSPVEYLKGLAHGSIWMLASAAVLVFSLIWIAVELWGMQSFSRPIGMFAAIGALGWVIGVFKVSVPRPQEPGNPGTRVSEWRALRWAARTSQMAWVLGTVLVLNGGWMLVTTRGPLGPLPAPANGERDALFTAGFIFMGVGLLGLSLVAFYLALLADWADDAPLARKLRMTPFALLGAAIFGTLIILCRPLMHDLPILFVLIPTLAVVTGLFLLCFTHFGVALVQFANVGIWAQQNASTAIDSDRRMSSKIVKRVTEAQAKAPTQPLKGPKFYKPAKPQGAFVARKGDGGTYEVAPPTSSAGETPLISEAPSRPASTPKASSK